MRIVSGTCRGRLIVTPANLKARPTTDFAKENLFNVISHRFDFEDISVLDLFSGTGSISYEFASRGVAKVVSVEMNSLHHRFIRNNAVSLDLKAMIAVKSNVFTYLKTCKDSFDIIFADPPYDMPETDSLVDIIMNSNILKENGVFILEHSKSKDYSSNSFFVENRKYGSVNFSFFANK